jgi:GNAT superfamily N-acetyltransferase
MSADVALAYHSDPVMTWAYGGVDDHFVERLTRAATAWRRPMIERGNVWCTDDRTGMITFVLPDDLPELYWHDIETRATLLDQTTDGGARYDLFFNFIDGHGPSEPHCMLDAICVAEGHRRQGRGTALMNHVLELARAQDVRSSLMARTPGQIAFFSRFGFVTEYELEPPGGGPKVSMMFA